MEHRDGRPSRIRSEKMHPLFAQIFLGTAGEDTDNEPDATRTRGKTAPKRLNRRR